MIICKAHILDGVHILSSVNNVVSIAEITNEYICDMCTENAAAELQVAYYKNARKYTLSELITKVIDKKHEIRGGISANQVHSTTDGNVHCIQYKECRESYLEGKYSYPMMVACNSCEEEK